MKLMLPPGRRMRRVRRQKQRRQYDSGSRCRRVWL